jgi:subtilisin family serine protease
MRRGVLATIWIAGMVFGALMPLAAAETGSSQRYLVVLAGQQTGSGFVADGAVSTAKGLVAAAGGTVANDLSGQIGVLVVESTNAALADTLRASALVEEVGNDFSWKAFESTDEALAGATVIQDEGGPEGSSDGLEPLQWSMQQIRTEQAHAIQAGWRAVDVGILDTGIDATHADFQDPLGGGTNVDCARGRNSIAFLPTGPGVGTPAPCVDNSFHGTHVAGIVAAQANGVGVVGVAPNVTLVPVKVCDASGYCYASAAVDGITYAGDQRFDVINMSFFVDDNEFQQSTEYKCMDDPTQKAFRQAVERAIQYARGQGVTPVAALGNSDANLASPPEPYENNCDVVPAETSGVIGTSALGSRSQKASYSNWGSGAVDVAAPGGSGTTGDCQNTVLSTIPGNAYVCVQGTSMASPHAAGVAALIVSQFGTLGSDGDVKMSPTKVEAAMQGSTVDIGLSGYDECFGNGRIDALRAVQNDSSSASDPTAPHCPEYAE